MKILIFLNSDGNSGFYTTTPNNKSLSVCTIQPKMSTINDSQIILPNNTRKASVAAYCNTHPCLMPSLTRLRIQQSFRNAKPIIGHKILKRASTLRNELKIFANNLNKETTNKLEENIFRLVVNCVANVDFPSKVASNSFAFDFFSTIADAMVAECVRQDGGAQKRCETLMAWSLLMEFIFSNVRDGYYAEVRQQRRSSLPQQRFLLKQNNLNNAVTGRGSL
uniref:Uncharacterized protein n=1 Tax=Meloidogyne enterolobii TaxID=390850 RepID=A0A6V7VMF1_MELEN|nr:unnamed protein product [Meloidogyne enterolobii]